MFEDRDVEAAKHVLDKFQKDLGLFVPSTTSSQEANAKAKRDLERREKGEIVGLPWPPEWSALGRRVGPIEPSSLTIIAARPAVGKSLVGLQLARFLAGKDKRVLFVSRELSVVRLIRRNWVAYGASMYSLKTGRPTAQDRQAIAGYDRDAEHWELHYDDHSKTVDEMREQAEGLAPDIVIIDYLQRLAYDTEKEYAAITRIVNELQDFTLETEVPVICLSQLKRAQPGMEWKMPSMSDTRGSGAVEERAANLIILHRHWDTAQEDQFGKSVEIAKTQSENGYFNVAKCSDGETGHPIPVTFNGARMRVEEKL